MSKDKHNDGKIQIDKRIFNNEDFAYNYQPLWLLILLAVATLGLYEMVWIYRNFSFLYRIGKIETKPWIKMITLFIPIYGLYVVYKLFEDLSPYTGTKYIMNVFFILIFILGGISSGLPFPYELALILPFLTIFYLQSKFNKFCLDNNIDVSCKLRPNIRQWIIIGIGVLIIALYIIGLMI